MKNKRIAGLILSAGYSSRMGVDKAELKLKSGKTFLKNIIGNMHSAGIQKIAVIANEKNQSKIRSITGYSEDILINHNVKEGMISSVRIGVEYLKNYDAVIVLPVDIPEIKEKIFSQIIDSEIPEDKFAVLPLYRDGCGHPLMLLQDSFQFLKEEYQFGLRGFIRKFNDKIFTIEINEFRPRDVDTKEEYDLMMKENL